MEILSKMPGQNQIYLPGSRRFLITNGPTDTFCIWPRWRFSITAVCSVARVEVRPYLGHATYRSKPYAVA